MTANAQKFENNELPQAMSETDWESWFRYREQVEPTVIVGKEFSKEEKMELLYLHVLRAQPTLEKANEVVLKKLDANGISMLEFVEFTIQKERQ